MRRLVFFSILAVMLATLQTSRASAAHPRTVSRVWTAALGRPVPTISHQLTVLVHTRFSEPASLVPAGRDLLVDGAAGRVSDPILVIHDTGSTNFDSGKTIRFTRTGTASVYFHDGRTMFFRQAIFRVPVRSLVRLVQRAGGPRNIRTGACLEPVSFRHAVWLTMAGQHSGDITCLDGTARPIDRKILQAALALEQRVTRLTLAVRDASRP